MSVDIKVAADEKLQLVQTYFNDNSPSSDFFNITELPDTLSGGKNAFLIAGSDKLFPQSEVKVQVRDAAGNVCYVEYADGKPEYYEGISKVVAVYVYPNETAFGPATITILGQAIDVPDEWKFRFNVKWQTTININPSLPNTTRVRFYKRPKVDIVETLQPIYRIESGSKVASGITASFADIKISQLETFAGDVKRVKVFRTSEGDISDFDLIQDILIESKELLTTFDISSSVKGNAGIFTNETLKLWNTSSLTASLTNDRLDNGLRLSGSGIFRYTSSLSFVTKSIYELNLDTFYSSSTNSNLGVYISGSNNGIQLIGTLEGTVPVKNLEDTYFTFDVDKNESTASLYLSQSQGEWHVANVGLKLSEDSAFSPNQIDFITTMPTVIGNETYNFKFEFYDVNNNYVPVAVTQSALFTGGNNNVGGTLILISGSISSSNAGILALSQSVSGTIGVVTGSVSQSFVTASAFSASLQSSSLFISSSISGTISNVSQSLSSSISRISASAASASNFNYAYATYLDGNIFTNASGKLIKTPATSSTQNGLYTGQEYLGFYSGSSWKTYMANNGNFYLTSSVAGGGFMAWEAAGASLNIAGSITVLGGDAATKTFANTAASTSASLAATNVSNSLAPNIFTDSTGKVVRTPTNTASNYGLYLGSSNLGFYSESIWRTYMDNTGQFFLTGSASNYLKWNGSTLTIAGSIDIIGGTAQTQISNAQTTANTATASAAAASSAASAASTAASAASTAASAASTAAGYALINANTASIFTNASGLINKTPTTGSTSGLYLGNEYMGYYNGSAWKTYMQNNGNFFLTGTNGYLSWNAGADTLGIKGDIIATNITATNTGNIAGWTTNATSISKGNISLNSSTETIQVGTGNGRVLINTETFNNRFDPTDTAKSISIGPGGIILKGAHTSGTPQSYIYLLQDGDAARQVITSTNLGVEPFAIYGHPTGNTSAAVTIYNGGLLARNFATTAGGTTYNGLGNGGYAIQSVGALYGSSTAAFEGDVTANTSDKRLKTNIKNIDSPLDKLNKINGVYFNWNDKAKELTGKDTKQREIGFIAQEVQSVLPEIVKIAPFDRENSEGGSKSGENYLTIQYEKIVPLLVESIKELKLEIEELKKNR